MTVPSPGEARALDQRRPSSVPSSALRAVVEQSRAQWLEIASHLHLAIDKATADFDARLTRTAEAVLVSAPRSDKAVSTSQGSVDHQPAAAAPLRTMDVNVPIDPERSTSSNGADRHHDRQVADLNARLLKVEQERNKIKEKYRREHDKFKAFKAWWEANAAAASLDPAPAIHGASRSEATHATRQAPAGSSERDPPAKRRRIEIEDGRGSQADAHGAPAPDALVSMAGPGTHAPFPGESHNLKRSQRPKAELATNPRSEGNASLPTFSILHLNRQDKVMLRSLGLHLPRSPSKQPAELFADNRIAPSGPQAALVEPDNGQAATSHESPAHAPSSPERKDDVGHISAGQRREPTPLHSQSSASSHTATYESGDRVETQLAAGQGWMTPSNTRASRALHSYSHAVLSRTGSPVKDAEQRSNHALGPTSNPAQAHASATPSSNRDLQQQWTAFQPRVAQPLAQRASMQGPAPSSRTHMDAPGTHQLQVHRKEASRTEVILEREVVAASAHTNIEEISKPALHAPLAPTSGPRYELNPDRNNGRAYEYEEVVRGREARRQLIASECLECKDWYERVGPSLSPPGPIYGPYTDLGKQLQAAREERKAREIQAAADSSSAGPSAARLGPHSKCRHHGKAAEILAALPGRSGDDEDGEGGDANRHAVIHNQLTDEDTRQAHRQAISRHRHTAPVPLTPPGFWEVQFPDTQHVDELNEQVAAMHQAHQQRLAADPRYRPRTSK